ncbi:MAG TPA: hypothetical protein VLZ75_03915 [Chitinophagales bacterium]|nr:hypothetical protein [Chitinophagales bacterium]
MIEYINNIIPRLKQFSQDLDKMEVFMDVPWVMIDENLNQQKYIFKRNGDFIMSLNGQVTIGRWEYLSKAKSLLIDRIQDKILLNQNFIDPAVMILKKDGIQNENFILANEMIIPNLNVNEYLKKLYYEKYNIKVKKIITGEFLEIYYNNSYALNHHDNKVLKNKVSIDGTTVSDGILELYNSDVRYIIKNSIITGELIKESFKTNKGEIVIEHRRYEKPDKGDVVFMNNQPAPDGKYRLSFLKSITVVNSQIVKL